MARMVSILVSVNKSKFKFRHTNNIHNALKEGMQLLNLSYENFESNKELYNALLHIKVDNKMIDDLVFRAMLPDNKYILAKKLGIDNVSTDDISVKMRNQMRSAIDYVNYGAGQDTNRGTAYWAYMGVNSYINNGVNYKDFESKFDSLLSGTSSQLDAKLLTTVMELL